MKTTLAGLLLAITILAGPLTAPFAIAAKGDHAKAGRQAAHQEQPVIRNEAALKAGADFSALGQLAIPSNGSMMITLVPVPDGSVRALKGLQGTDSQNVGRRTVVAGMPDWIWCMIHFCKRWG